jgi:hypothetical protein
MEHFMATLKNLLAVLVLSVAWPASAQTRPPAEPASVVAILTGTGLKAMARIAAHLGTMVSNGD